MSQFYFMIGVFFTALWQYGEGIMCHRCFSAMGGCGADGVTWRMFPWRDCGDSKFCVKVITRDGGEDKIIRECESNLMKSAYHRLRMPVLRRHGYCLKARHNDFWNPRQMEDPNMEYCFCNDWNGCNGAPAAHSRLLLPLFSIFTLLAYTLKHIIL